MLPAPTQIDLDLRGRGSSPATRRKTPTFPEAEPLSSEEIDESETAEPEQVAPMPSTMQVEPVKQGEPETKPEPYRIPTPEPFETEKNLCRGQSTVHPNRSL